MDEKQKRSNDVNQEIMAYSEYIDNLLGHITELSPKYLPVSDSDNKEGPVNDLLDSLRDGILFGYILNQINPKSIKLDKLIRDIDLSSLDAEKNSASISTDKAKIIFKVTANHNIILESAKKCGIVVVNIGSEDILQKNVGCVLGLLWQMIRSILLKEINIDSHPELILLLDKDESLEMAGQLSNEQLLLRWFNFHLKKNGAKPIQNFAKDISDSEAYFNLFERLNMIGSINSRVIDLVSQGKALPTSEKEKRAELVLQIAQIMDCKRFININRIVNGHARLNLSFVATIFNKYSDVNLTDEESMEYVRELIRRMRLKDKEHYLPLDQEIEYVRKILANNPYLESVFYQLYGDRINQIGWLNEYALDDTFDKPKEEAILHELSEIEKRDNEISDLKSQIESNNATIEEKDQKIKEMEEASQKQKESFKAFKKEVTEQLRLIETMMKKDMSQINKMEKEAGGSEEGEEEEESMSDGEIDDKLNSLAEGSLDETYKKVESYVKRLLEELKKSKEQNYIYKSQIAQNDKINAILNEKIYQYSENACKETNSGVSLKTKANSKGNLAKKKFVPS